MDLIPEIDETIRKHLQEQYQQYGLKWLQKELQQQDPLYAQSGEMQNPQRMLRALEVVSATGTSILKYRKGEKQQRNFQIIKIGLELPRAELYDRINKRVDQMMELGLLAEVKLLVPFRKLNALQTVGYKELFEFIDGTYSLQNAIDKIKQNSRHYAKRQLTWFKRDIEMKWFHPEAIEEILQFINSQKKPE
jgi:tRNA dimethylallyltransferase